MSYEIRTRKLQGSPHTVWQVFVGGVPQGTGWLHPPSADMIRDVLQPKAAPPVRPSDYKAPRGKTGPKPPGWKPPEDDEDDLEDAA